MNRRRYHHGDLRRALIEAALERIAAEGADALSLRAVARDVGVTHAAPYRHFESKTTLIAAIAEEGLEELNRRVWGAAEGVSDRAEMLMLMGAAYVRFAVEKPGHFKVLYGPYRLAPHLNPASDPVGDRAIETMVELWGPLCREDQDPRAVALGSWTIMHGIATLLVDGRLRPELLGLPSGDLEGLTRLIVEGSRKRPVSPA